MPVLPKHLYTEVADVVVLGTDTQLHTTHLHVMQGTAAAADVRLLGEWPSHGDIFHSVDDDGFNGYFGHRSIRVKVLGLLHVLTYDRSTR